MAGFIKIDRSLLEWRWHDMPSAVSLWIHLLLKANWKDGFFMGEPVPRGSLATSYRHLSEETGINFKTVVKWIKRFEEEGQIEVKSYSRFTLIKLINYAKFQDENLDGGTVTGTQSGINRRKKEKKEGNKYIRSASSSNLVIAPPDYFTQQKEGTLPEDTEPTEDLVAEILRLQGTFGKVDE